MRTNNNLLLLDIKMGAGHAGASGRFDQLRETALEWAFALKILDRIPENGMNKPNLRH
jgi:oligopeptidase B